ncbi:MAG: efflux RND transporter periplasmic adaptor subunit [Phaeodactylibacter sp.]|nr:efflux RND transporter periplasmic adaptor subunit [Phaeodactylibacter sp.]MCB9299519.1 efflux RND transporter periplasmic adaptor subunit [Lewinellaceae bacterium]
MTFHRKLLPLVIAFATLLAACNQQGGTNNDENKGELPVRIVETAAVVPANYRETVFATGKLSLEEEAKLSFKTGGVIKQIYVAEGQSVRQGQLLAELDLAEISAQTQQARLGQQQAEINVENAKLALKLAERDFKNAKGLYRDSVATLEQLQNAEVQLDNARNQLQAAQKGVAMSGEQVGVADFNLKYSRINAPSNGIILKKLAEANELAGPGTPIFLFGSKDKAKVVRVNITDKDIIHVQLGNDAELHFDAYPGESFKGTVREMASMADPYTNTFEVEIEVAPTDKTLLSGFISSVQIYTSLTPNLMKIPIDALLGADKMKGEVFVVDNGKAVKTPVNIFKIQGESLLIQRGLDSADRVVTSGVGYLEDQQPVMISQR